MWFRCHFFWDHPALQLLSLLLLTAFWCPQEKEKNNHMAMHDSFFFSFFFSFLPSAPSQLNPPAAALPDLNLSNCDEHLSHLFCSLRKKKEKKKILKLDYTQTKREALWMCVFLKVSPLHTDVKTWNDSHLWNLMLFVSVCWSSKRWGKKKGTISFKHALMQAILFFYWKCYRMDVLCKSKVTF